MIHSNSRAIDADSILACVAGERDPVPPPFLLVDDRRPSRPAAAVVRRRDSEGTWREVKRFER